MAKEKKKEADIEDKEEDVKKKDAPAAEGGAEGAEGEGEGAPAKKSKKKIIIAGVLALVVLIGAGAGAYFTGLFGPHEAKVAEGQMLGPDGKPIAKPVYYTLP